MDLEQLKYTNQQLDEMKRLGFIEDYSYEVGDTLETSKLKLKVRKEMIPLVFKTHLQQSKAVH